MLLLVEAVPLAVPVPSIPVPPVPVRSLELAPDACLPTDPGQVTGLDF